MRFLIRGFFRTLRLVLGPFMLLGERLSRPAPIVRTPDAQERADRECRRLTLYQFRTCPFCIRVRKEIHRLALTIATRDAQHSSADRAALESGGGQVKVPCLKIETVEGCEWLYESGAIIDWLQRNFDPSFAATGLRTKN